MIKVSFLTRQLLSFIEKCVIDFFIHFEHTWNLLYLVPMARKVTKVLSIQKNLNNNKFKFNVKDLLKMNWCISSLEIYLMGVIHVIRSSDKTYYFSCIDGKSHS